MREPLVSISCLTYNHSKFIKRCLDGFLMQKVDFKYEVLIYDDASTDGTSEIIREYAAWYPNVIKPIIQTENQYSKGVRGMNAKFNFPRAKGKYLAICEGDDYWTDPEKLQKQVNFMEANPEFSLCFTNGIVINEQGEIVREVHIPKPANSIIEPEQIIFVDTTTYTFLFRRELLNQIPEPLVSKVPGGDTLLKTFVSKGGPCKYLDFQSGAYRVHSGGIFSLIPQFARQKHMFYTRYHICGYLTKPVQFLLIQRLFAILKRTPTPADLSQKKELRQMHRDLLLLIYKLGSVKLALLYIKNIGFKYLV